ncbi:hypothetical protein RRG08_029493 [Elysia crispata]|uniref:Uncharacterized protein n=1 Tax=Elysia crispata TaxID=231223 RepID=A0AAE0ZXK9_9GAST|nr:hypothetical protein RRG08_029493 [Elysia crispata]
MSSVTLRGDVRMSTFCKKWIRPPVSVKIPYPASADQLTGEQSGHLTISHLVWCVCVCVCVGECGSRISHVGVKGRNGEMGKDLICCFMYY